MVTESTCKPQNPSCDIGITMDGFERAILHHPLHGVLESPFEHPLESVGCKLGPQRDLSAKDTCATGSRRLPESDCVPGVLPDRSVRRTRKTEGVIPVWSGWNRRPLLLHFQLPNRRNGRVRFAATSD